MAKITDKERLDWLTRRGASVIRALKDMRHYKGYYVTADKPSVYAKRSNPRAAIDAAIRAERKPKEAQP